MQGHRGWIEKEGKGALHVWQKRYFVLSCTKLKNELSWFVSIKADKAQNSVDVRKLQVEVEGSPDGLFGEDYYFTLHAANKSWRLKTIGVVNGKEWCAALNSAGQYPVYSPVTIGSLSRQAPS
jgi:hypothetical protein